ncbi:MAG: hypothetical protein EP344_04220 [Bacteroidetes bacterium]|nr:MAG: hypothetical protein EP344_04220 [Bacteroidota bacterium]
MKFPQRILIALFFCIPMGLFAQSIAGDWETQVPGQEEGTLMTIKVKMAEDGTYAVDLGGDGAVDITGKYQMKDGVVTIQDDGTSPDSCTGKGMYKVEKSDTTLTMTKISDECEGRGGQEGKMEFTLAKE